MTRERFEALAEAYGGDVTRWPEAERDAAALLMAADASLATSILARAESLDAALDAWAPAKVSHELRERVIASAPAPRAPAFSLRAWILRASLGAGLAAACVAGLAMGVAMSDSVSAPAAAAEAVSAALDYDTLSSVTGEEA